MPGTLKSFAIIVAPWRKFCHMDRLIRPHHCREYWRLLTVRILSSLSTNPPILASIAHNTTSAKWGVHILHIESDFYIFCISCIFFCIFCVLHAIKGNIIKTCLLFAILFCIFICIFSYWILLHIVHVLHIKFHIGFILFCILLWVFSILSIKHILHILCMFCILFCILLCILLCLFCI